jgi:hypothetical protein
MMEEPKDPQYPSLRNEIMALDSDVPAQHGAALMLAEHALSNARGMRDRGREVRTVTEGYSIVVETDDGIAGFWSCWLRDSFFLGFPQHWPSGGLDIDGSFPGSVAQSRYRPDYGRNVGNVTVRLPVTGRSAALLLNQHSPSMHHFHTIKRQRVNGDGRPPAVSYGHDSKEGRLMSEPYWRPDDGDDYTRLVQDDFYTTMEAGFLRALVAISSQRKIVGVTAELGFVMVPENLEPMGYDVSYVRGEPGHRDGWGAEVVYGSKRLEDGRVEEIVLSSANSMVPWVCFRRQPTTSLSIDFIRSLLTI